MSSPPRPGGADQRQIMSLDIGGTKMLAAVVDAGGTILRRSVIPTPPSVAGEPTPLLAALQDVIDQALAGEAVHAAAIASAGPIQPATGTVSPVNIPGWRDFPLAAVVSERLGGVPVRILGDAVAAAYGEYLAGAGQRARSLLGIVVSTGIGGGLVLAGRPFGGAGGNAGHIGHYASEPNGEPCNCGSHGCLEMVSSGPAMVRWARNHGWAGPDARRLVADARLGQRVPLQALDRGAWGLAAGIQTASLTLDLDRVVIGGGVAAAGPLLLKPLLAHIASYSTRLRLVDSSSVVLSVLGADAAIVGCARLARELLGREEEGL